MVMAEREQKRKRAPARADEEVVEAPPDVRAGEKIKAELDDLLDEIDEVLETNAEDFVRSLRPEGRRVAVGIGRRSPRCRAGAAVRTTPARR